VLTAAEARRIDAAFASLPGDEVWTDDDEDVHGWIERLLTERLGPLGGKLHTGRSRNDLVAACLRRYVMDRCGILADLAADLARAFCARAARSLRALLPAYTHLQRGQPTTLGHHLAAYAQMFLRDRDLLREARRRADASPLGAGAATGTGYPIDRARIARAAGFSGLCPNSLDAVSDRDFALSFLAACAQAALHLARLGEEWVIWASTEFGFLEIPEALSTGSSIMPNKRNPDAPELLRARAARVTASFVRLAGVLKGLPLAYNKDLQEDKEPVFDAADALETGLEVALRLVRSVTFREDRMRAAAESQDGLVLATELADLLVRRGLPFREAHRRVTALCGDLRGEGRSLRDLGAGECTRLCPGFTPGEVRTLSAWGAVARRTLPGGPSPAAVAAHLARLRRDLQR
jgi:argininosuccinate lyase